LFRAAFTPLVRSFNFLVTSKLFLAFVASLSAGQTFLITNKNIREYIILLLFVFCATLFAYTVSRVRIYPEKITRKLNRNSGIENSSLLKAVAATCGFIFSCVLFFLLKGNVQFFVAGLAACTFAYNVPVTFGSRISKGIRSIFILKNVWLAFVWACVTVVLPLLGSDEKIFSSNNLMLFLSRLIFIYVITVAFDIRDVKHDAKNNLKTLPTQLGISFTKWIAMLSLVIFCVLIYFHVNMQSDLKHIAPAFYISAMALGVLVLLAQPKNKLFFYDVMMDGMLVLQAGLVFAYQLLK